MAHADRADKRVQDLRKVRLLCAGCEELFSKHESYFSREIFRPYHDGSKSFEYDRSLELFAISLSWRALKTSYDETKLKWPSLVPLIDEAESCWRSFLLGEAEDAGPYESHLAFLGQDAGAGLSLDGSKWYKLMSVDPTLAVSESRVFAYSKLPSMLVVTSIGPRGMKGWKGTVVKAGGKMTTLQRINDAVFSEFFSRRALDYLTSSPGPSEEQSAKRLEKAMKRDSQRVMKSESVRITLEERDSARRKKMAGMPELVRELVEHAVLQDVDMGDEHNQSIRLASTHLADLFAALTDGESRMLDRAIGGVMDEFAATKPARALVKADSLWVVFMAYHSATIARQDSEIKDEIRNLQLEQGSAKTPIVVFYLSDGVDDLPGPALRHGSASAGASAKAPRRGRTARLADVFCRRARKKAWLYVVFFDIARPGGNVLYVNRLLVQLRMQGRKVRGIDTI